MIPRPAERDPGRFAPVFVLAPARSYTSAISAMIGQHPQLAGLPELKLLAYPSLGEMEASLPRFWIERGVTHRSPGLVRAVAEFVFGGQTLAAVASARTWLRQRSAWSGAEVLDCLMERILPRRCVEKSPENVETSAALERLASAYPRACYLHLTRHPLTTQRSIRDHLNRILPDSGCKGQPMAGIAAWYVAHQRIMRFAGTVATGRYLRVRAEDVLNDPRTHLAAIARWLGLRDDAPAIDAMTHPEVSPFARPGPDGSGVSGGNDPAFLRDPRPRRVHLPATLDAPAGWSEPPAVWRSVVELAIQLGYTSAGGTCGAVRRSS
jgi:hypothetical protein